LNIHNINESQPKDAQINIMTNPSLASAFECTLLPDQSQRREAELFLEAESQKPDFPSALLQISCCPDAKPEVKLAAAIQLAKQCEQNYRLGFSLEVKSCLKQRLLPAILQNQPSKLVVK
jgi:hypothetical protein